MLSKFVTLLRRELTTEREQIVHRLSNTERMSQDQRESLVGRNLQLLWVERKIDELYKADEDQIEEMGSGEEPAETPPESNNKPRRSRRRAGTWGAS